MRGVWCCFRTVVFVTICSARSLEEHPMDGSQIKLPKCCEDYETFDPVKENCKSTNEAINYDHYYYDSNETHINTERVKFTPKFYKANCSSNELVIYDDTEILGIIFNSSLIENVDLQYSATALIMKYCVMEQFGKIAFRNCDKLTPAGNPSKPSEEKVIVVYLPFLILSTLCYFFSAFVYGFVLKVKQEQKKCFIGYALSMGVTFTFLVILQTIDAKGGCNVVGSFFFFSIISSFVWLACLCLELILMVRNFKEETNENRIPLYLAISLMFPLLVLLLSMVPHGKPDVPDSFMKRSNESICKFKEANMLYFFIAIGVLMASSLIFLGYNFYLMGRMEGKYRNHFSWLEKRSKFKYMSISCTLIWLTSAIWIVDTAIRNLILIGNPDVYDVIEALQGIFTVAIFVTDRYTRRELYENLASDSARRRHIRTIRWLTKKFSSKPETSTENPGEERVRTE